jgi:hypothetical protein
MSSLSSLDAACVPSRFNPIDAWLSCRLRVPPAEVQRPNDALPPILSRLVLEVTKFIPRRLVLDAWRIFDDANESDDREAWG